MQDDDELAPVVRLNARTTDAFDIFNCRFFAGPSLYLDRSAIVFDLALTGRPRPTPVERYVAAVAEVYPELADARFADHAALVAGLVLAASRLDMGLELHRSAVFPRERSTRIAVQALDRRTHHRVVYFVWDWLEAIGNGQRFDRAARMAELQHEFKRSPYGGPTTYALLSAAEARGIPTFHLRDEGLIQYGYGRRQVRGVSTTFSTDSQLDSDFTTRKDDCKDFLGRLGFPVPQGDVVGDLAEAETVAREIGYPVAVKPLAGHKGIGVTANVQGPEELALAFARAGGGVDGAPIIVETSLAGSDFRLLCANGRFVAALQRRPPWVEGDGRATVDELIARENATPERADSPTSPLAKIIRDEAMLACLAQQGLTPDSVPAAGREVWLRKVANLSAGGVSIDVTGRVHPDNALLAEEVAQQFQLTCMGIDVMAVDLGRSWRDGGFGIIEINAAPGVFMHVKPAKGTGIDVPGAILDTWFGPGRPTRVPVFAFNRLLPATIAAVTALVRERLPRWNVGAVCADGVFVNGTARPRHRYHNTNVRNLLRNPTLDLLLLEYDGDLLAEDGMAHTGHDLAVLEDPTPAEEILARDLAPGGTLLRLTGRDVAVRRQDRTEDLALDAEDGFARVLLREVALLIGAPG